MKERPILFSAPMVRALLAGTKTQTRRAVKWRNVAPGLNLGFSGLRAHAYPAGWVLEAPSRTSSEWRCDPTPCPYGAPGDRLWVRETWAHHVQAQSAVSDEDGPFVYAADGAGALQARLPAKWTPGIHMFRWASRITLDVTGIRVERLQDISEADATAEGVLSVQANDLGTEVPYYRSLYEPRDLYRMLWESINGPGSWDANPWVWVVQF